MLGVLALLGTEAAHAANGSASDEVRAAGSNAWGTRGRLQLRGAFARHDQTVSSGVDRTSASGSAVSHLAADGAWMAERLPLGLAASLAIDRFALQPTEAPGSAALPVTGIETTAGLLARLGGPAAVAALEAQLGYGLARVPMMSPSGTATPMSSASGQRAALQGHGPALAARLTVAVGRGLDLEATARALPVLFGARVGDADVQLRRFAGGAGARVGLMSAGTMRLSALVGYEADLVDGSGAVAVHQLQHRIGLGLRAVLGQDQPPLPDRAAAPAPRTAPPPAARPVVRGLVLAAGDQQSRSPLAGVSVATAAGAITDTDAEGRFHLDQLPPGLAELRFSRDGFEEQVEVVAVPSEGEVVLEIRMRALAAPRAAALIGQVRTEDGVPVEAQVRVLELGLAARADKVGRFRFDVPPGRYTLTIEATGFVSQRKAVPVGAAEQNIFNVNLQRQR